MACIKSCRRLQLICQQDGSAAYTLLLLVLLLQQCRLMLRGCNGVHAFAPLYLSGMKREEWVAPMPGLPCLTGL